METPLLRERTAMPRRKKDPSKTVWDHERFQRELEAWFKSRAGSRIEDFCHEADLSVSTVRRLSLPNQDPGFYTVSQVADVFGVRVEDLLKRKKR